MPAKDKNWHFGVLSSAGTGHLNPLIALSQELVSRGHRVTFFDKLKLKSRVVEAGLEFAPIAGKALNSHCRPVVEEGLWNEVAATCANLARIRGELEEFLENTPGAVRCAGVDALLVDEISLSGPTIAQMLRLPYFVISTSIPHQLGWRSSSWLTGYRYSSSCVSWLQGVFLELSVSRMRGPLRRWLDIYRRRLDLGPMRSIRKEYPWLAQITQLPRCLDLPRRSVPAALHYAGPFVRQKGRPDTAFPWDRLDGRPLIYASLGTTRSLRPSVLRMIAEACCDLDAQLVISLGNRISVDSLAELPGQPIVAEFAPQLQLLKLARVVITHGGANTVLETLLEGKPMVVIPLAYDQPAVAARVARTGAGMVLPVMRISAGRIRNAIARVLTERRFCEASQEIQRKLRMIRGTEMAADLVETALERFAMENEAQERGHRSVIKPRRTADARAASYLPH